MTGFHPREAAAASFADQSSNRRALLCPRPSGTLTPASLSGPQGALVRPPAPVSRLLLRPRLRCQPPPSSQPLMRLLPTPACSSNKTIARKPHSAPSTSAALLSPPGKPQGMVWPLHLTHKTPRAARALCFLKDTPPPRPHPLRVTASPGPHVRDSVLPLFCPGCSRTCL